jgi:hypothetical protein
MATEEVAFIIGNGKTAKVGDKVWYANLPSVPEQTIVGWWREFRDRTYHLSPRTNWGNATSENVFLSQEEAIAHRIEQKHALVAKAERSIALARKEIASLESLLVKESADASV